VMGPVLRLVSIRSAVTLIARTYPRVTKKYAAL